MGIINHEVDKLMVLRIRVWKLTENLLYTIIDV